MAFVRNCSEATILKLLDTFTLLKFTEDPPKELLFIWVIAIKIYHIRNSSRKIKNTSFQNDNKKRVKINSIFNECAFKKYIFLHYSTLLQMSLMSGFIENRWIIISASAFIPLG